MPSLKAAAVQMAVSTVDLSTRIIEGTVITYGVVGATSMGPMTVNAGAVRLPERLSDVKLTDLHGGASIGFAVSADDTAEGLTIAFKISETPAGDQALLEADPANPVRDGLSVELDQLVTDPTDESVVTDSLLSLVALVPAPAYTDARVTSVAASYHPQDNGVITMPPTDTTTTPAAPAMAAASQLAPATTTPAAAAAAPLAITGNDTGRPAEAISDLGGFYAALTQRAQGGRLPPELTAALLDITQTSVGVDLEQPAWIGQLWDGVSYQRKIVPLFGPVKKLTSYKVTGWRWGTKPAVAAYAGDKTDVPSNAVTTDPFSTPASRLAGAHDIDRKFRDFNDTEFFQAYYEAMTESYARLSDDAALAAALAGATDEATPAYPGFLGAIAAGVSAIDDETGAGSTFVIANKADLIPYVLETTNFDLPAMLEVIGVDLSRIVTHSGMTAGHVLVGTAPAMDYYELPGSPIRVEAIDMVKGGIDAGVFGYYATVLHDAAGIVDVTIDTSG